MNLEEALVCGYFSSDIMAALITMIKVIMMEKYGLVHTLKKTI